MSEVLVFGSGDCGQLGLGDETWEASKPIANPFFSDKNIVQVAAGGLHSLALGADGRVWSWGCNDEKALGHLAPEFTVGQVEGLPADIIQIACGDSISAALAKDGSVWTWGTFRDSRGLLGHSPLMDADYQERPCKLEALQKETVVQLSAGANHLMAVTATGSVYAWGSGEQGQLGRRILERHKRATALRPTNVTPRSGRSGVVVERIACGAYHTLFLTRDGQVFVSGLNNHGQLGLGDTHDRINAELIDSAVWQGQRVVQLSAGEHHSLALTDAGRVFAFGRNDSGQCGVAGGEQLLSPIMVPTLSDITMISSGSNHNLTMDRANKVCSWGFGEMHQLGHGTDSDSPVPRHIVSVSQRVMQVSAGGQHSIILVHRY